MTQLFNLVGKAKNLFPQLSQIWPDFGTMPMVMFIYMYVVYSYMCVHGIQNKTHRYVYRYKKISLSKFEKGQ